MKAKLAELKLRQAEEMARAEREVALFEQFAATVPAEVADKVKMVFGFKPIPWVTFEVNGMGEALDIIDALGPLETVDGREAGCTSIAPSNSQPERYRDGKVKYAPVENAVLLNQSVGRGFCRVELDVFTASGFRVKVEVKQPGLPAEMRDVVILNEIGWGQQRATKRYGTAGGAKWFVRFGGSDDSIQSVRSFSGTAEVRKALAV